MRDQNAKNSVFLKEADENDLELVVEFVRKNSFFHLSLDDYYYLNPDLAPLKEIFQKSLRSRDEKIFLAQNENSQTAGLITCVLDEASYFDTRLRRYGVIMELYVEESFRRHGIGNALLKKAQEFFKEQGCISMHLQTSSFNSKALSFYRKAGFEDRQRILIKPI